LLSNIHRTGRRVLMSSALAGAVIACAAAPARAQQPASGAQAPPPFNVKWNNGLSLESNNGDDKFQVGALLQTDGRFAVDDPAPTSSAFLIRRARIIVQGRAQKYFEFLVLPEFGGSSVSLLDAYIDTKLSTAFRIRTGKSKTPLGLEQLYSDAGLPFAERSIATNLAQNRDVGVDAQGDLFARHVSYVGGVRNGVPDAGTGITDTDRGKDLVGRITVRVGPIGAAIGGTHGSQSGVLPSFKTTAQQTFFSYSNGVTANGRFDRVSPAAFAFYKSVGGFAEYLRTTQAIAKGAENGDVTNSGWEATGIVVLTGEMLSDRGVGSLKKPFDPAKGQWGALQIAARVSSFTVDPLALTRALQTTGSRQHAAAVGLGLVWYATSNVKHMLTYEHTVFDRDATGARKAEDAVIFRVQINMAPGL
jgi:phosphate-selective porin OprO/OprP